jgi:DnaD/phage-associated family protein
MAFGGFPQKVRFTPVPSPVFGPLLEQIDDAAELKCLLRIIWLLHQKRSYPRFVSHDELLADQVLARGLSRGGGDAVSELEQAIRKSVRRGTIATGTVGAGSRRQRLYTLNTPAERKALAEAAGVGRPIEVEEPGPPAAPEERPNIFALYEDNVGMLSPMIADELREAEENFPAIWIEDAFREAVENNKRSWRYIAAILDRWEREGKSDGGPGRGTSKTGYQEYFRR